MVRFVLDRDNPIETYLPTSQMNQQLSTFTGVGWNYYQKCSQEAPTLLCDNVNYWLERDQRQRFVRTIGNNARAFLSRKYLAIDNVDLAQGLFPILDGLAVDTAQWNINEDGMRISVTLPRIQMEVQPGDPVKFGLDLKNSEVGQGFVEIRPFFFRLVCRNGLISKVKESTLKRMHMGSAFDDTDECQLVFRDETREQQIAAFLAVACELVEASLHRDTFNRLFPHLQDAATRLISGPPPKVIEVTRKRLGIEESKQDVMVTTLFDEQRRSPQGTLSQWSLANAVTALAHTTKSANDQERYQKLGWDILTLPAKDFQAIAAGE